jgi:SLBB domain
MNMHIVHPLVGIFFSLATTLPGKEVWVHFAGQLNKPGVYKVSSPATVEELAKACGGWTEFGSSKRLTVVRACPKSRESLLDLSFSAVKKKV